MNVGIDNVASYENLRLVVTDLGSSWGLRIYFDLTFRPYSVIEYVKFYIASELGTGISNFIQQPWADEGLSHPSEDDSYGSYSFDSGSIFALPKDESFDWQISIAHYPEGGSRIETVLDLVTQTAITQVGTLSLMPAAQGSLEHRPGNVNDWKALPEDGFVVTPPNTSQIIMLSDFTDLLAVGNVLKIYTDGAYVYNEITAITADTITLANASLSGEIGEILYKFYDADWTRPKKLQAVGESSPSVEALADKVKVVGDLHSTDADATTTFEGNVVIKKSLNVISDEVNEIITEIVRTQNDKIILRDGAITGLGTDEIAGMKAMLYNGILNGILGFTAEGWAVVGDEGDEQRLMTREDAPDSAGVMFWDNDTFRAITSGRFTFDGKVLRILSDVVTITPSALITISWSENMFGWLTLNQDTTINFSGTFSTGQIIRLMVDGNKRLFFLQSGFTFIPVTDDEGELTSYNGYYYNIIQIMCVDAPNKKFIVLNNVLQA